MKVILTGGGTGGHAYPAVAVAEALREFDPNAELFFIGSAGGPEGLIASQAGIPFKSVPCSPFPRSGSITGLVALGRLLLGIMKALFILRRLRPDVVVGTGGYVSAPTLVASWVTRVPAVIHEQNVVPGRANRWLARFVDCVCVSFDSSVGYFSGYKVIVTGLPIRKQFASLPGKSEARRRLRLNEERFTLLVVGGSQGSRKLNQLMFEAWPMMVRDQIQVIHQTGPQNLDQVEKMRQVVCAAKTNYHIEPYVDMPLVMAAADLLVGRSGASTVAEATAVGLPCIFIPYPFSVADEQIANARYIADKGAALVFSENEITPAKLAEEINNLRLSPGRLQAMAEASRSLGRPQAASDVAKVAMDLAIAVGKGSL
ncbi:MAG: undecaprenyldiphospho-muramoylpentapeptide beta-N-acetylglucosaminyltransferase [Armatimonadota bacterium]